MLSTTHLPVALHLGVPNQEGDATGEAGCCLVMSVGHCLRVALHIGAPDLEGDATSETSGC